MMYDEASTSLFVYVEKREPSVFQAWVERNMGPCQKDREDPSTHRTFYNVEVPWDRETTLFSVTGEIESLVLSVATRGDRETARVPPDPVRDSHPIPLVQLKFYPPPRPWATDAELGRQLSRELGVDVLCTPDPASRAGPGVWLFIRRGREELLALDEALQAEARKAR